MCSAALQCPYVTYINRVDYVTSVGYSGTSHTDRTGRIQVRQRGTTLAKHAIKHQDEAQDLEATCAHATNQAQRAGKALAQAEAVCRAHGARLTPIRRKVLEALYATHKPLGAYDLAEILGPKGRRLAPITVYRALDFLIEQGLAHRLASQNAYIALPNSHDDQAVAYLICEKCGGVDELAAPALSGTLSGLLAEQQFQPNAHVLEITGRCAHCQDAR
jgi:Fur family transcriptional regulator, zinc uptake regulator